jgi:hypothetical protein
VNVMGILDGLKVRRLSRELENPDPKIRMQAADELGSMGGSVVEPLIQVLVKPEKVEIVHIKVIQSLGKLKDTRALIPLLKILYGRLENVPCSMILRIRAAEALGEIEDPRSIMPILQFLKVKAGKGEEFEGELLSRLREVLVIIGTGHIDPLTEALKDSSDTIRVEAARALKDIGNPLAVPSFIEAFGHSLQDLKQVLESPSGQPLVLSGSGTSRHILVLSPGQGASRSFSLPA